MNNRCIKIQGVNCKWYEGATAEMRGVPTTDNGLEGLNGSVKTNCTLRRRLLVNEYLANCFRMLRNWSLDSVTEKQYSEEYQFNKDTWKLADECLQA